GGLIPEVADEVRVRDDHTERVVSTGSGERSAGSGVVADHVGVPVGPGEHPGRAGVDADQAAGGTAAVGGGTVAGQQVAGTAVGERAGGGTAACDDPTHGVVGVGLAALGDGLPEGVVGGADRAATCHDRGEGTAGRVRVRG